MIDNPNFPYANTHYFDSYKAAGLMSEENFPKDKKKQAELCDLDYNWITNKQETVE